MTRLSKTLAPVLLALLVLAACGSSHPAGSGDAGDDSAGDARGSGDRGTDGGADGGSASASCGVCRAGATCDPDGACRYHDCVGAQVPGDYATLQAAVSALDSVGGTICLGPQHYAETVHIDANAPLEIAGVSADQTVIDGTVFAAAFDVRLSLRGLGVDGGSAAAMQASATSDGLAITDCVFRATLPNTGSVQDGVVELEGDSLEGAGTAVFAFTGVTIENRGGGDALRVYDGNPQVGDQLTLDGVDLSSAGGSGDALAITLYGAHEPSLPFTATVLNSYLHDAAAGVGYLVHEETTPRLSVAQHVTLENDTIMHALVGLDTSAFDATDDSTLVLANNLLVDDGVAIDLSIGGPVTADDDLFFGDTTNFAGAAIEGSGDLKVDPMLDGSTPPVPGASSPALGAGDPALAPDHDFWNRPRGTHIDLGAVQRL